MTVVDASAVVDLLTESPHAERVRRAMLDATMIAPAHLDAEVLSALARLHRSGDVTSASVAEMLSVLADLRIRREPFSRALLDVAWSLRENVTARDAIYVALAAALRAPLLTTDTRLARAVPDLVHPLDAD